MGSLKYVSMSCLRDDWISLGVGSPQHPDTLVSCVFKTELVTHLRRALPGGLDLRIGPVIEYAKKPGKLAVVKVVKDSTVPRDDLYKSSIIHVGPGEPSSSTSRPTPKGRSVAARPVTTGKLLRPGGPGGGPARNKQPVMAERPVAQSVPRPSANTNVNPNPIVQAGAHTNANTNSAANPAIRDTQPNNVVSTPSQPQRPTVVGGRSVPPNLIAALNTHSRNSSTSSANRAPPPAPPPPPALPPPSEDPTCRALYDFAGQSTNELSLVKDEVVIIVRKEENGWWLIKRMANADQGWAPSAYLKEEAVAPPPPPPPPPPPARPSNGAVRVGAVAGKKPAPPAPPAKRPAVGRKPATPENRSSVAGSTASGSSGTGSSTTSFAGGLAQAVSSPAFLP